MNSSRNIQVLPLALVVLLSGATLIQAIPPPMLRAACSAFADAEEAVGNSAMAAGKAAVDMAMKPIAIVGGLKTAAVGTGLKLGGGAMKFVGEKMVKDGAMAEVTGAGMKGVGLGVAALAVKPAAEHIVSASKSGEESVNLAAASAEKFAKSIGDTSIQIDASIDSPILGHHRKEVNMTAGLGTAVEQQHTEQQQQQIEQIDQQTSAKSKRATKVDTEVLKSALNLVREAKMEDCVARAICDLNCNPQGFGQDGKQVFMNMVRLQGANVLESGDSKLFQEAASKGRNSSGKCEVCSSIYKCNSKSSDLIKMASHIRMDN